MIVSYLKYLAIIIIAILLQKTFIWLISISRYNITPDLVILAVIYGGLRKGHIGGAILGFIAGVSVDILSSGFIGLSALSYCITGFIAGYFFTEDDDDEKKSILTGMVFLCVFVGLAIYYFIYYQGSGNLMLDVFIKYVLPTTTYTTIIGLIFILFLKNKRRNAYT